MPSFNISPDVVSQRLGDETVIVHLGANRIYTLNVTGTKVWETLASGADPAQAGVRLLAEYDVDPARLSVQIANLLERLRREKLVIMVRRG